MHGKALHGRLIVGPAGEGSEREEEEEEEEASESEKIADEDEEVFRELTFAMGESPRSPNSGD